MRIKVVLCGICTSAVAFASIADDFKDASNRDGCEAIPYSSERGSCESAGRDVDDWCKNSSRKWSCDDLDPTGINRNIDNVNSKINDLSSSTSCPPPMAITRVSSILTSSERRSSRRIEDSTNSTATCSLDGVIETALDGRCRTRVFMAHRS